MCDLIALLKERLCKQKSQKLSAFVNPIALRKAKIVYNFGLSECNKVKKVNMHRVLIHLRYQRLKIFLYRGTMKISSI